MVYRPIFNPVKATLLVRRLRYLLSRMGGTRLQRSQRVTFATLRGQRFKRLILRDSFLAAQIERNLTHYGPSDLISPFVIRYENEIWVEFVDGERLSRGDERDARDLAAFYAAINNRRLHEVALDETRFHGRLKLDLRFLNRVGVLADDTYRGLCEAAEELRPERVRLGFDYTDPVLKNFVRRADDGAICAIDVESLEDRQLIGTGPAKAFSRWMAPHRAAFLEAYRAAGGPDISHGLAYVELCFLAGHMKLMFLEQKWRFLQPELLERFVPGASGAGSGISTST